ncbi:unnamed protein product, partial [Ectocarpus sp. 12 AP-2014]
RSFDIYLEGARQAEAAAARALLTEVANKNPIALWLDSILGTPVAQAGSGVSEASPKGIPPGAPGGRLAAAGVVGAVGEAGGGRSYFDNSVAAYAIGLGLCFTVNFVSKSGQPALLYLNPALLSSAILTAVLNGNGELGKLLAFGVGKDSEASEDDP